MRKDSIGQAITAVVAPGEAIDRRDLHKTILSRAEKLNIASQKRGRAIGKHNSCADLFQSLQSDEDFFAELTSLIRAPYFGERSLKFPNKKDESGLVRDLMTATVLDLQTCLVIPSDSEAPSI